MIFKKSFYFLFFTIFLITGCGGGGGGGNTSTSVAGIVGYVIDSPVVNLEYRCANKVAKTEAGGKFSCTSLPVKFMLGNLEIGEVSTLNSDSKVFIQDIVDISRANGIDEDLVKIGKLLQSLAQNGDINNQIILPDTINFSISSTVSALSDDEVRNLLLSVGVVPREDREIIEHFRQSSEILAPILANATAVTGTVGTAITPIIFSNSGGAISSCSVTPTLPIGLSLANDCTISGTATATQALTSYTVIGQNITGSNSASVTITLNPALPILANATAVTGTVGTAITPIVFNNSGGAVSSCIVTPTLPTGLSLADNCTISGTATATQALTSYTVTGHNITGSNSALVMITINPTLVAPVLVNATAVTETIRTAITPIVFSNSGGAVSSCSVTPTLPTGLSLANDCTISGTATAARVHTTYTVTGTNSVGSSDASVEITIEAVIVSGKITYDSVPFSAGGRSGLDYNNIVHKDVRGVVVQALDASNNVINTTSTDNLGRYSFLISSGSDIKIRVLAQLYKVPVAGETSWDFQVKDNTNSNALYIMDGRLASVGTGTTQTRNLNASSGWGGSSYTSTRTAAPFAILDVIYKAIQKVTTAQSDAVFPALDVFWSKNNITSTSKHPAIGQILTSHYDGTALYILGKEDSDTDEYDSVIIGHEWGHYYEAKFSRSDSIGWNHGGGDMLDIRVAFGEGFGDAMGCIVNDTSLYLDSYGTDQGHTGVFMDLENGGSGSNPGWYSELSIARILYDVYDNHDDTGDTLSLGFTPMHNLFIGAEKNTEAFTSIFTFITALKAENSGNNAAIDALTTNESIASITDIYGVGRSNRSSQNANPLYSTLSVGSSVDFVTNYSATSIDQHNRLGTYNFITFTIPSRGNYTIQIAQVGGSGTPDPDIFIYKGTSNQPVARATAGGTTDTISTTLTAGTYRMSAIVYGQNSGNTFRVTLN